MTTSRNKDLEIGGDSAAAGSIVTIIIAVLIILFLVPVVLHSHHHHHNKLFLILAFLIFVAFLANTICWIIFIAKFHAAASGASYDVEYAFVLSVINTGLLLISMVVLFGARRHDLSPLASPS